jgi:hypothetical protein
MQHYVHNHRRHHGHHAGEHSEHFHVLEESMLGLEHSSLVHQELEELRHFAPLTRQQRKARKSGTSLSTAKTKLSTLVRYVYLSLF